ncbi:MAG: TIGR02677 family protein, partial [bacterium]|nr:TIGR02677 family protein [bacterium]
MKELSYAVAEKAPLYRAVMGVFMAARQRFVLHLRPQDVTAALADTVATDPEAVAAALDQLCGWGNLEAHPDTADVTTVEDFYRRRNLYQLTPEGEAAERALDHFDATLRQPGELQTAALDDVRVLLGELLHLAGDDELDAGKVHRTLRALCDRFDELTSKAQTFIGSLQRAIDLHGVEIRDFVAYKEMLIDYLERFISELVLLTGAIAASLHDVEARDVERLLDAAAERDLADALEDDAGRRRQAVDGWRVRWQGLRAWFIGDQRDSQAEILRKRARSAIPDLLNAAAGLHERRLTRSDRTSDLRTLARWFAQTGSERDAHRLWRAAFALAPARHLSIDDATLDERDARPVSPQTSWLEAPPLRISPQLRKTGSYQRRGRPSGIVDRRREKALLAELAAQEAEQILDARRRFAGRRMRLSEIGELDAGEFQLFLDLLGEVLARRG